MLEALLVTEELTELPVEWRLSLATCFCKGTLETSFEGKIWPRRSKKFSKGGKSVKAPRGSLACLCLRLRGSPGLCIGKLPGWEWQ
jgi:hypothetical protein